MAETNGDRLIELLTGQTWEQLQTTLQTVEKEQQLAREILWGGPGRDGIVHAVDRLSKTVEAHENIIHGNGGKVGLRSQVAQHERLAQRVEKGVAWLITLVVMQLIGVLGSLAWWIFTAVAGS